MRGGAGGGGGGSDVRLVAARRVFGPSFAAASDSAWCGRRSLIVRVRSRTRHVFFIFLIYSKTIHIVQSQITQQKKHTPRFCPGVGALGSAGSRPDQGPGFGLWPLAFHAAAFFRLRRQPAPPRAIAPEAPPGVRC